MARAFVFDLKIFLFLENIGAVQELSKVTDNLGHRIDELETHTVRMSNLSKFGSIKSTDSGCSSTGSPASGIKSSSRGRGRKQEGSIFRNRWIQGAILCLVGIMTICLLAMAILYIMDYQRRTNEDDGGDIPDIVTNTTFTFPPIETSVTTRSTSRAGIVTTTRRSGARVSSTHVSTIGPRVTTSRHVVTSAPTPSHHIKHPPTPIGRPHDCSGKLTEECTNVQQIL